MTKSDLTEIMNEHVCVSNGIVHRCKVQWVASEPRFKRRGVYLAAVEVVPEDDRPTTVHLMFERSISPDALLKLLDDAVVTSTCEHVAQSA